MAAAEVASRPQERSNRRKPFTQWVKNLANLKNKGNDQQAGTKKNGSSKYKRSLTYNDTLKRNNPYPESGHLQQRRHSQTSSANGGMSVARTGSYGSLPTSTIQEREGHSASNRSGAPTVATNPETVYSDAGHSKAATTTTHGGALSSIDGAGADSTFSSPNHSQHSLTTTLTTIQSTGAGNTLHSAPGNAHPHHHGSLNNPNPVMFSHQYPVSPAPSTGNTISAIPRHLQDNHPNTYNSATAGGLLSDNASIITLASSSKRRRRSMDTDHASVRALAPSSVFGGSRESLPLSVLSGNAEGSSGMYSASQSRPSMGGIASAERASIYSAQGAGNASDRNSYYSYKPGKDLTDAKSLRSITNMDARSLNADAKSMGDVGSLRNYDGSIRSGKTGHIRNESITGSVGGPISGGSVKHTSGGLSRRSSDWQHMDAEDDEEGDRRSMEETEHEHDSQANPDGEHPETK